MPKLRLFRGPDPLESDVIPFPRSRREEPSFRLRLTGTDEVIRNVESAFEHAEQQLAEARLLLASPWFDDDGPRAA
ncbi:MAG: hypothetical protein IPJ41_03495 [Phycisphaerales bacterium]|nr:hypothetical protein [Phycisphaerales bacterium]